MTLLSILIPSIPSRFNMSVSLYNELMSKVAGKQIEILCLTDNKKRTIGEKREALKNISNGKYFMFVDDDDSLYSIDEIYEACKQDVDVITFKSKCLNADGSSFIVTAGLKNDVEHNTEDGRYLDCKRPAWTQSAWASKFKSIQYPAISYGEDWEWVKQATALAETEIHIPEVLHGYNFNQLISEASTESNIHWVNPNMPEIKRCVVNLSTSQYWKGQQRLIEKMKCQNIDVIAFMHEHQVNAPIHNDNPYAFKIYAIQKAIDMGYNQILWLDASVYPVKDVSPVFHWLTEKGIFLEEAGHYAGSWCNENALNYFKVTREQAMQMPMFSAGYCGFDFRNNISVDFFAAWKEAMLNGAFKGSWADHRHDMSAGSIIANQQGLLPLYSKGGTFFSYVGEVFGTPKETVCFHLKGL